MTDSKKWRVGQHYDIHIYNEDNVPIATAMTPQAALQIVNEHNLIIEMEANLERSKQWLIEYQRDQKGINEHPDVIHDS